MSTQIFDVYNEGPNATISLCGDARDNDGGRGALIRTNESNVLWRIKNFLSKRGGACSSDDLWATFGSDEVVAPFIKQNGGTCAYLKMYPEDFVVENAGPNAQISMISGHGIGDERRLVVGVPALDMFSRKRRSGGDAYTGVRKVVRRS